MVFKPTAMGGKIMYLQKNSSLDLKVTANKHHKIFFTSKGSFRSWKKIVKDDDDDERGNLCWSPFLGSGPDRGCSPVEWGDFPFVCPSVHPSDRPSIHPSIHLSIHPSVRHTYDICNKTYKNLKLRIKIQI